MSKIELTIEEKLWEDYATVEWEAGKPPRALMDYASFMLALEEYKLKLAENKIP